MNKYQTLGIAYISKNLVLGQEAVVDAVRKNRVSLVLISKQSSENTIKVVTDKCKFYGARYEIIDEDGEFAKALGKKNIKVLGVKNEKLANKIYSQIKGA